MEDLKIAIALLGQQAQNTSEVVSMLRETNANNVKILAVLEEGQRMNSATLQEVRATLVQLATDHNELKTNFVAHRETIHPAGLEFNQRVQKELDELKEATESHGEALIRHEEKLEQLNSIVKVGGTILTTTVTGIVTKLLGLI